MQAYFVALKVTQLLDAYQAQLIPNHLTIISNISGTMRNMQDYNIAFIQSI